LNVFETIVGHALYGVFVAYYVALLLLPLLVLVGGAALAWFGVRWFMRSSRPLVIPPDVLVPLPAARIVRA
jgi:hypothetical protein